MTESNHLLAAYSVDYMFVTVFYAIYNTRTGLVNYCNAGHTLPYLLHANGTVEPLPRKMKNPMVGAIKGVEYKEDSIQLEHGDILVMYTDGVTEAMNTEGEEMGIGRMEDMLSHTTGMSSCRQVIETIKTGIANFVNGAEQSDDITMLVLTRK
jgi:sigma-B regulation protein RsbU (phosphoserine phosphatase)